MRPRLAASVQGLRHIGQGIRAVGDLPAVLLIGAQKAGTTSLFNAIAAHPAITAAQRKELHFFDENWQRGRTWYRRGFVSNPTGLNLEATPAYLFHPHAAARAAVTVPDARLIVVLRDPVRRALSQHRYETRRGYETLSFEDAVAAEPDRTNDDWLQAQIDPAHWPAALKRHSYLRRGHYAQQLARWRAHFPANRMLVIEDRELHADAAATMDRVFGFLGLDPVSVPFGRANATGRGVALGPADIAPKLEQALRAGFADDGAALRATYGDRFSWLR